jgi:hypothetical protein
MEKNKFLQRGKRLRDYFPLINVVNGRKELFWLKMEKKFSCIAEEDIWSNDEKTYYYNLVFDCRSFFGNNYLLNNKDDYVAFSVYKESKGMMTSVYNENLLRRLINIQVPRVRVPRVQAPQAQVTQAQVPQAQVPQAPIPQVLVPPMLVPLILAPQAQLNKGKEGGGIGR